jgi:hypothetical protein
VALLAAYGRGRAYLYGFLMNLSFWPFALGGDTALSYVAGVVLVGPLLLPVLRRAARRARFDDKARVG